MKCLFVSKDSILKNDIRKSFPQIEEIVECYSEDFLDYATNKKYDIAIVSDLEIEYLEIEKISQIDSEEVYYLLHDYGKPEIIENIKMLTKNYGVRCILPKLSRLEIINEIKKDLFNEFEKQKKVISFLGSHRDIGMTHQVLSLGNRISEKISGKVCVVSLSAFSDGDDFVQYKGSYLDEIYTQLNTRLMSSHDLISKMHSFGNFYFMAGNRDIINRYRYSLDSVSLLIDLLKEQFDLVLIDAGAEPENSLTLRAIEKSDFRIIMTTQQPKGIKFILSFFKYIFRHRELIPSDFMLIINKYNSYLGEDSISISKKTGIPLLHKLEDVKELGFQCEIEKRLIIDLKDKKNPLLKDYLKDIDDLSNMIIQRYELQTKSHIQEKKKKFFGII